MSFSGKTAEELLEEARNAEERYQRVQALNSTAQVLFEDAYSTGEDSTAVEFAENVFAPELQGLYAGEDTKKDLQRWQDELSGLKQESGIFHAPITEPEKYEYLRSCMEVIHENYDHGVGVHSGGLAPLYAVEDIIEAQPVVLRYSHRDREDEKVQITSEMEERADFKGSDVLILDDVIESGETARKVAQYLDEEGAEKIDFLPVKTSMWEASHDYEILDLLKGETKYRIIDYERRKERRRNC